MLQSAHAAGARAVRDRLKLALRFDAEAMRRDLSRLEASDWVDHFVPQNYEGTWSILPLRAPAGAVHPIKMIYSDPTCDAFVDTPLLAQCEYFRRVLAAFHCPLHAVRLMKLTPGSIIKPHTDHDLAAEQGRVRLHIPVATNPDVDFRLNGEPVVMCEGECWYLRLSDTHSVANRGGTDRVHLVIDAIVTPWLEEQLMSAGGAITDGWIPFRIHADRTPPVVDWCDLGEDTFTEPFFTQTIERCRRKSRPPSLRETSIATLVDRLAAHPGVAPAAFIFHTSRCGSTLVSQMAAALPRTIVISEAPPIDDVLRAPAPEPERIEWLRALVGALGQPRRGDERHLFVKFDAWHILNLTLVQRAFPGVPCLFLYRDPAAVVASQLLMPGLHTVPGLVDPSVIGLDLPGALRLDRNEYVGRMLAAVYAGGLEGATDGRVTLMNYSELPGAALARLLEWCGLTGRDDLRDRLLHVCRFDAKTPSLPYDATEAARRPARNQQAIDTASSFVAPHYKQLESLRLF
ncbi:MAG TPA: aspartyl/asparaginyl beta-hydroxylase domain-containing protein [Vicinamibacterales bacterium]